MQAGYGWIIRARQSKFRRRRSTPPRPGKSTPCADPAQARGKSFQLVQRKAAQADGLQFMGGPAESILQAHELSPALRRAFFQRLQPLHRANLLKHEASEERLCRRLI